MATVLSMVAKLHATDGGHRGDEAPGGNQAGVDGRALSRRGTSE